jgi:hypothetical protein
MKHEEPAVFVCGQRLSNAQAMTVRVAHNGHPQGRVAVADIPKLEATLLSFEKDLRENGLGNDHHGRTMVRLYTENSEAVRSLLRGH